MPRSLKKGPFVDTHLLKKVDALNEAGVGAIFGPGTNIPEAAAEVLDLVRAASVS